METLGDKIMPKLCPRFSCSICDYHTSKKSSFDNHINSNKHKKITNDYNGGQNYAQIMPKGSDMLTCSCGKQYQHRQGLWKHKKTCNIDSTNHNSDNIKPNNLSIEDKDELIMMLIKQNAKLMDILENGTHNTNHSHNTTNSHNKAFNLQFFLNETCKNAMNITDFVDSIKLQLSDFMNMGELGFVEGISNIIVKNLNSLDETIRPIHCTDQKRETFYVKDENIWQKEEEDRKKLMKMIKSVAFKNEKLIKTYKDTYPDYNDPESRRSDQYSKIMIESMDCKDDSREKIIKNISKATIIAAKV